MRNKQKVYYSICEKNKRNISGVTLLNLAVTITILVIIAGVTIYSGKGILKEAEMQELRTNMLLIQAKSKEYVTKANFKMGIDAETKSEQEKQQIRDEVYGKGSEDGAQLEQAFNIPSEFGISGNAICYWLTEEAQTKWGLDKIQITENEKYLIEFDEKNETVEVYNTPRL